MFGIARSGLNNSLEEVSFTFSQVNIPVECWMELGSNMNKLKTLRFRCCDCSGSLFIAIASWVPKLQELDIGFRLYDKECVDDNVMEEVASKLKELRMITIPYHRNVTLNSLISLSSNCTLLNEIVGEHHTLSMQIGYALRHFSNLNSVTVHNYFIPPSYWPADDPFYFENSISYARALCALTLHKCCLSDAFLCSIAQAHLPLKELRLLACIDISISGLSILLQEYHSLTSFEFSYSSYLTDQHINHLSRYLRDVTHIDLSYCSKLTNSTFFILAKSCPLLVDIKMTKTLLGRHEEDDDDDDLGAVLTKNSNVHSLNLSCNYCLNDATLKRIGYVCPNLQILDLSFKQQDRFSPCGSDITEQGTGEMLKSCPGIRHLKVDECQPEMILGTGSEFSKLNIEILEAKMSKINDQGMELIGIRCPALLKLDLNKCANVTTEGVKRVVEKCPKLMEIDLAGCHKVGPDVLPWMLATRRSLRKIISPDPSHVTEEDRNLFMRQGCRLY